ncbi:hypothetical protein CVT25_009206 [Psilocybe cyanescens]|uniref:F-box domain-containing protein n=1 Tax=Psilocybe cyanescens TaxID=93625 RepID=A0A409WWI9_PSICY|nr:hypothetical protein CVT25_009206 [Psilocybe cyanescens]
MVYLTFDVYEIIIDMLAEIHILSLKSCSLVCNDFARLCRKHIFHSIELDSTERRYTRRFDRLLNRSPSTANYVRSLTFVYNTARRNVGPPVLHSLHRVKDFTLRLTDGKENYCGDPQYDWEKLPSRHRSYFYSFIQSNSIEQLSLVNIQNLPATILTYFPHLTSLKVDNVSILDAPLESGFSGPMGVPKLISIWSRQSNLGPLRKLLSYDQPNTTPVLDLTGLENMGVSLEGGHTGMDVIRHLLQHSQNLKCLSLSASYDSYLNFKGNLASSLTHGSLKTLKMMKIMTMVEDQRTDPYLYFVEELEQIGGQNVLETLSIEVDIETNARPTTELSKWAQLDRTLSAADAFPYLRSVSLEITIWRSSPDPNGLQARFEEIGREGFRWLRGNEKLEFIFKVAISDV